MTAEALAIAPGIPDGSTPQVSLPPIPDIPFHLRRRTLKKIRFEEGRVPENLWGDRGDFVEVKLLQIVASQTMIVEKVTMNPRSTKGSDFKVAFVKGFSVKKPVFVEGKSSTIGKRMRKQEIRDKILTEENDGQLIDPWISKMAMDEWNALSDEEKEMRISGWLTDQRTILVNGGEEDYKEKTTLEILNDSFLPQLERIWLKDREAELQPQPIQVFPQPEQTYESPGQLIFFPTDKQIQVFPEAA